MLDLRIAERIGDLRTVGIRICVMLRHVVMMLRLRMYIGIGG